MHPRLARLSQFAVVLLTIAAWFAISNHCLFGAVAAAPKSAAVVPAHCHGDQSPSKQGDDDDAPCCKVLRATVETPAKIAGSGDQFSLPLPDWTVANFVWDQLHFDREPLELDTGPPVALSFTELIFQRSILAHAPPFLS